jgi:hypothetical protein
MLVTPTVPADLEVVSRLVGLHGSMEVMFHENKGPDTETRDAEGKCIHRRG